MAEEEIILSALRTVEGIPNRVAHLDLNRGTNQCAMNCEA